jgi:hypothetical protein
MKRIIDSTLEFAKEYPVAFEALPEAYQADDVLRFTIKVIDCELIIIVSPKPSQASILGDWKAIFSIEDGWINLPSSNG